MREKMRQHLTAGGAGRLDLKQDRGGIADIEFLVQYLALRWGYAYPEVLRFTDNVRLLEGLTASGCLPATYAATLTQAYLAFRARAHAQALQGEQAVVPEDAGFARLREDVTSPRGGWRNRVARVLLNFFLTSFGTAAGVWLAGWRMLERLF